MKRTPPLDVALMGRNLRLFATHHNHGEGWTYTRNLRGMKHIRYKRDWEGWDAPGARIKRAFSPRQLLNRDILSRQLGFKWSLMGMWAHIVVSLRTDRNMPDGALNDGIVITVWEEDGEYIEWVGPTVGQKIADFLEAEPDHPHARAIAAEMRRVKRLGVARRKAETDKH